ncbi:MAG: M28 family peptidase [Pirellulaceae bacterium]
MIPYACRFEILPKPTSGRLGLRLGIGVLLASIILDGSDSIVCSGMQNLLLEGKQLSTSGQRTEQEGAIQVEEILSSAANADEAFDAENAFRILTHVCEMGGRVSTSAGMLQQQKFLTEFFETLGVKSALQRFQAINPVNGQQVELQNLVVRLHPERRKRLLLACHYDTRPFPDKDPLNPQGTFIGANDGASGVGLLCELSRHLANMEGKYGIDIIFFDGEEFVYVAKRDPMFLGSTYFAETYAQGRWDVKYEFAILVDMVGDKELQIGMEGNSLNSAPKLTKSIWSVAIEMGSTVFVPKTLHTIRDDHLPLNYTAKIPTCDIIDFDYPNPTVGNIYWHTEKDIPENCSAESLDEVGRVLFEWLRQLQKL